MELGEASDNEEQRIPDIIISRSSIPDAERARNIRMLPTLEDQEEESETDLTKESGASEDDGDRSEQFRQDTQPPSDNNIEIAAASKVNDNTSSGSTSSDSSQAPQSEVRDVFSLASTKAGAAVDVFPTPNVEEYFSEYEDATEDEQMLVADQAHQFKADTAAFEHLESSTPDEQDNTDKFRENCNIIVSDIV